MPAAPPSTAIRMVANSVPRKITAAARITVPQTNAFPNETGCIFPMTSSIHQARPGSPGARKTGSTLSRAGVPAAR